MDLKKYGKSVNKSSHKPNSMFSVNLIARGCKIET